MSKHFLSLMISLVIMKFDTQDNLVKIYNREDEGNPTWEQNVDLDTLMPANRFGLWRIADNKIEIRSNEDVKAIRLNNFPYKYWVKKKSNRHFIVKCLQFPEHWDGSDIIEVVAKI